MEWKEEKDEGKKEKLKTGNEDDEGNIVGFEQVEKEGGKKVREKKRERSWRLDSLFLSFIAFSFSRHPLFAGFGL